jgi:hypothetical protein
VLRTHHGGSVGGVTGGSEVPTLTHTQGLERAHAGTQHPCSNLAPQSIHIGEWRKACGWGRGRVPRTDQGGSVGGVVGGCACSQVPPTQHPGAGAGTCWDTVTVPPTVTRSWLRCLRWGSLRPRFGHSHWREGLGRHRDGHGGQAPSHHDASESSCLDANCRGVDDSEAQPVTAPVRWSPCA